MNLILFRKITLISNLSEAELIRRVSEIVDLKKRTFSYPDPAKKYIGKIESSRFKIYRIIKGRNSFIPIIQGNIVDNFTVRSIEIKMRPHFIVIMFLLWVSGLWAYYLIKLNTYDGLWLIGFLFGQTIFFLTRSAINL